MQDAAPPGLHRSRSRGRPVPGRQASRVALAIATALLLSTCIPYALHARRPIPGMVYSGLERYTNDNLSYLMWINQARLGAWSVTNLFTHDARDRFAPHPLWAALGLLARVIPLPPVVWYHLARLALGMACLWVLWRLAWRFSRDPLAAWTAWALAATGSGLGWIYAVATGEHSLRGLAVSADYMPELWTYSSLLYFPHFAAALLLMALTSVALAAAWHDTVLRPSLIAGLSLGLLVLIHPYSAVTLYLVIGLHLLIWRIISGAWRPVRRPALTAIATSFPFLAFQGWQTLTHESLRRWSAGNLMPSPPPSSYLLGFGIVGVLGLIGLARTCTRSDTHAARPTQFYLVAWVLASVILIYSGLSFERRCVEGLSIALCLLAAPVAVEWFRARLPHPGYACAGLVVLCLPGSVWYVARELASREGYVANVIPEAEEAIAARLGPGIRVFCEGVTGQWLPAGGRLRVYLGHAQLTPRHQERARFVAAFFDPVTSPAQRLHIFEQSGCDVVLALGEQASLLRRPDEGWREAITLSDGAVFVPRTTTTRAPTAPGGPRNDTRSPAASGRDALPAPGPHSPL